MLPSSVVPHPWPAVQAFVPRLGAPDEAALRASLAESGQLHPVVVLPDGRIIDGHRRYAILGDEANVEVLDLDDACAVEAALVLNIQRRRYGAAELVELHRWLREHRPIRRRLGGALHAAGMSDVEVGALFGVNRGLPQYWRARPRSAGIHAGWSGPTILHESPEQGGGLVDELRAGRWREGARATPAPAPRTRGLAPELRRTLLEDLVALSNGAAARRLGIAESTVSRIRTAAGQGRQARRRKAAPRQVPPPADIAQPPQHRHEAASFRHMMVVQEAVKHWCQTGWLIDAERDWSIERLRTQLSALDRLVEALEVPIASLHTIIGRRLAQLPTTPAQEALRRAWAKATAAERAAFLAEVAPPEEDCA